jgi:hypothetical protein
MIYHSVKKCNTEVSNSRSVIEYSEKKKGELLSV